MTDKIVDNLELYDMIENEGFYYLLSEYGPPAPEELEDKDLKSMWAEAIALAKDLSELEERIMRRLEDAYYAN